MIGLISAVPREGGSIAKKLTKRKDIRQLPVYIGNIHGADVVYAVSGIGKTNASHALAVLLNLYSPSVVINFGIGGAYPSSGLKVGDIAVAEKEIYGDEGVLDMQGFHGLDYLGIPLIKKSGKDYFNEFSLNKRLSGIALKAAARITSSRDGIFVTVSTCTGTSKKARELMTLYNPICENMEGAAITHISLLYGIPCIELRGISNIVEDRDKANWDILLAAAVCQDAVIELIKVLTGLSP